MSTPNEAILAPALTALWAEAAAAGLDSYDPTQIPLAEARARARRWHAYWGAAEAAATGRPYAAPGPDGVVRGLSFGASDRAQPVVLYHHGGGYVVNDVETHALVAARLAAAAGLEVISIDYSAAPERRFPWQIEESLAVMRAEAGRPLLLAGDSAGAHLALATALAARDRGLNIDLRGYVGFYGMFRYGTDSASHRAYGDGRFGLSSASMDWFWRQMLPESGPRPRYTSLVDEDLRDLPPCFLIGAALDCLSDDSRDLAAALTAADVAVTLEWAAALPHSFLPLAGRLPAAQAAIERAGAFLRQAAQLGGGGGGASSALGYEKINGSRDLSLAGRA